MHKCALWLTSAAFGLVAADVQAQSGLEWVSRGFGNWQPFPNYAPQISGTGRFVLYLGHESFGIQFIVVDRNAGFAEVVSRNAVGEPMNQPVNPGMLRDPVLRGGDISDDGRFVVFASSSTNLVSGTADRRQRVYLFDRNQDSVTLIAEQPMGHAVSPVGDRNLDRIVYISSGSTPETQDVWLYERTTGDRRRLLTHLVEDLLGPRQSHVVSGDGRYLVFGSRANGWVPEDQNGLHDVFRLDLATAEVAWVSVDANGMASGGDSYLGQVSSDGEHVSFLSGGGVWLPVGTMIGPNGFVKDLRNGQLVLANAYDGQAVGYRIDDLVISGDGSTVAFRGFGAADSGENGLFHVYRRRLDEPRTHMVDLNSAGESSNGECHIDALSPPIFANRTQFNPSLSDDGRHIAFSCQASNLLPGVSGMHVYVRSYAGTPNSALPIPSQGAWGLSLLVAGVAGLGLWSVRRAGGAGAAV